MGEMPPGEARPGQEADCNHFRILDLPDELIVRIINHSVITSSQIDRIEITRYEEHVQPAITRTCRSFRAEGLPIFYKHNYFEAFEVSDLCQWLQRIGRASASSIKHIQFIWCLDETKLNGYFYRMHFFDHLHEYPRPQTPFEVPEEGEEDEMWSAVEEMRIAMHDHKVILTGDEDSRRRHAYHVSLMPEKDIEWTRVLDLLAWKSEAGSDELEEMEFWAYPEECGDAQESRLRVPRHLRFW